MHGLIFETSIWLLAGSTRFLRVAGLHRTMREYGGTITTWLSAHVRSGVHHATSPQIFELLCLKPCNNSTMLRHLQMHQPRHTWNSRASRSSRQEHCKRATKLHKLTPSGNYGESLSLMRSAQACRTRDRHRHTSSSKTARETARVTAAMQQCCAPRTERLESNSAMGSFTCEHNQWWDNTYQMRSHRISKKKKCNPR